MARLLGVTKEEPFFKVNNEKIFFCYDPPHVIKCLRNALFNYGLQIEGTGIASWEYVEAIYELDSARDHGSRMLPRLTARDLELKRPFAKLSVPRCMHVMSNSAASAMENAMETGTIPIFAAPTHRLIKNTNDTFDCLNTSKLQAANVLCRALTPFSPHKAKLEAMMEFFSNVGSLSPKFVDKPNNLPSLQGVQLTINCILKLMEHLFTNKGFSFLLTRRINQDPCENLFAFIRSKGGNRTNPNPREFRSALVQVIVARLLESPKGKNCEDDLNEFLFGLDSVKSFGADSTIESKLAQNFKESSQSLPREVPEPPLTLHEESIVSYVGGWIVKKIDSKTSKFCSSCINKLSKKKSAIKHNETRQKFLMTKQYKELSSDQGLKVASDELLPLLDKCEQLFLSKIEDAISGKNVLYSLIVSIVAETSELSRHFLCPKKSEPCTLQTSIIHVFVKCRFLFEIKQINRSL